MKKFTGNRSSILSKKSNIKYPMHNMETLNEKEEIFITALAVDVIIINKPTIPNIIKPNKKGNKIGGKK